MHPVAPHPAHLQAYTEDLESFAHPANPDNPMACGSSGSSHDPGATGSSSPVAARDVGPVLANESPHADTTRLGA